MDWLADIISKLPLDSISETVSEITLWWSDLVADVPHDMLPIYAYVGFSCIVLILWLFIVRILPKPIGGMSWLAVFSILLTPGVTSAETGDIAPASIGVVYGILMKDPGLALRNLLPILVVFTLGLVLGFIWQLIRNTITSSIEKSVESAHLAEKESTTNMSSEVAIESVDPQEVRGKMSSDTVNHDLSVSLPKSPTKHDGMTNKPVNSLKKTVNSHVVPVQEPIEVDDPFVKNASSNYAKIVDREDVKKSD